MNLNELVGSKDVPITDKLNILSRQKLELESKISNRKKLRLNFYHHFSDNFNDLTNNNKGKEIVLALEIVKNTRRGDKKYEINLKQQEPGSFFISFFRNSIYLSEHNLYDLGINYRKPLVTFKTMVIGANKLVKTQIISNTRFNMFMKYLEDRSIKQTQETNEDTSLK